MICCLPPTNPRSILGSSSLAQLLVNLFCNRSIVITTRTRWLGIQRKNNHVECHVCFLPTTYLSSVQGCDFLSQQTLIDFGLTNIQFLVSSDATTCPPFSRSMVLSTEPFFDTKLVNRGSHSVDNQTTVISLSTSLDRFYPIWQHLQSRWSLTRDVRWRVDRT